MKTNGVPKIRFKGFTDDWEERKLSSGLHEYTDRVIVEDDKEYYQISVRNNFGGITLRGSKMGNKIGRKRQAKINLTKYPQTLIFTRQTVEQGGIGWVEKYCDGAIVTENMPTISLDTSVFSKYFLTNLFQTKIFYKNAILDNIEGGSAQIAIHESKFLSSTLLFPNLDEQEKIGSFFKQIDETITLHQRKCEQTKELKKFMLQKMFPKKGEKNPEIRFPGFTDDWEQRKLSECAGFRRGSFPQPYGNKEWYDGEGGMPFVQVADVADDMKLVDDTKQKISKMAQPMSVYADKGSVLVTLQGSIGRVAITQYGAFVDRTVLIFDKYNQDIDKTFWAYIIKEKFIDEARKAPGGTIKTITKEALSDFDLMLPNYDEQKKISSFLMSLDRLITLHQRKCEQLKELKKFMLQNMFPKKG